MTAPKRIQRSRLPGWRMPPGAIYVGRPTIWGNPFPVGRPYTFMMPGGLTTRGVAETNQEALDLYRIHCITDRTPDLAREHLAGHDLACWCPLKSPCHADILLALANPEGATP